MAPAALPFIVRTAFLLGMGLVAGYAIRDKEADAERDATDATPRFSEDELRTHLRAEAMRLISNERTPDSAVTLEDHLRSLYRGLYYLGRTGGTLKGDAADRAATLLRHMHHQHRPRDDRQLISWYETVGAGSNDRLAGLLSKHPLCEGYDTRYIAHAFGEKHADLSFTGLLEEMVRDYKI